MSDNDDQPTVTVDIQIVEYSDGDVQLIIGPVPPTEIGNLLEEMGSPEFAEKLAEIIRALVRRRKAGLN